LTSSQTQADYLFARESMIVPRTVYWRVTYFQSMSSTCVVWF